MAASAKRETAKRAIQRTLAASKKSESYDQSDLESFLTLLKEQWSTFREAHDLVLESCGPTTIEEQGSEYEQAEEYYRAALANLRRKLAMFTAPLSSTLASPAPTDSPTTSFPSPRAEVKLPRIEIPNFSGDVKEWISFRDLFNSLIVSNRTLAGSQKLHYLRSGLSGEALQIVKTFQISDDNFREAWTMLNNRYDIERVIVDSHFSAIFTIPKVMKPSFDALRNLIVTTDEHVRALKALGRQTEGWDDWLVHLTVRKLDAESHKLWELSLTDAKVPQYSTLRNFLETRCRSLEAVECHIMASSTTVNSGKSTPFPTKNKAASSSFHISADVKTLKDKPKNLHPQNNRHVHDNECSFCKRNHRIYICDSFKALSVEARAAAQKQKSLCENCLSPGHSASKCRSPHTCRVCQRRHHTLLHVEPSSTSESSISSATTPPSASTSTASAATTHFTGAHHQVLLATAIIKVLDASDRFQTARALLDSASHVSFITESCVQRLGLHREPQMMSIQGIGSVNAGKSKGSVVLPIQSIYCSFSESINAYILPQITSELPVNEVNCSSWPHISKLQLADPQFSKPGPIDILIGADYLGSLLLDGIIKGSHGAPHAQNTQLGWVLFGRLSDICNSAAKANLSAISLHCDSALTNAVKKFWELEDIPKAKLRSREEQECEDIFQKTHSRLPNGRFVVNLPFKSQTPLGKSREAAVRALLHMERRFTKDNELREQYTAFIHEYLILGHMERVPQNPRASNIYYLPHHSVVKESSSTTRLRVVFNASKPTSTGISLNDSLMVGPQLQDDLSSILLRFRSHKFAMTGDVVKMYRQVQVAPEHTDCQRIVWRDSPSEDIRDYRLTTVTYGLASSSYLAVKSMQQCALYHKEEFPKAATIVCRDFYVDDLLTGSHSEDEIQAIRLQVTDVLKRGCFEMRKWASNSANLMESIPPEQRELKTNLELGDRETITALGLQWTPSDDYLLFSASIPELDDRITKRKLLSHASKLFDPLGLLAPATITAKVIFQKLWQPRVDWDEEVPANVRIKWLQYCSNIRHLGDIRIPRWLGTGQPGSILNLHGFADASQVAFAAAIYARVQSADGNIAIRLISAKTRLAPLKTVSLPRLELCAAVLLARLLEQVMAAFSLQNTLVHCWTDSTVTLAWLSECPSKWSTFVANRVSEVQEKTPSNAWRHVPSGDNPADCASRGISPMELLQHPLWWSGPSWLQEGENQWPKQPANNSTTMDQRKSTLISNHSSPDPAAEPEILQKFSSLAKLQRVVAYIFRFAENTKSKNRKTGCLTSIELFNSLNRLISITQIYYFPDDIQRIKRGKPLSNRSRLLRLQPHLDAEGILRVGGRLRHATITSDMRHPAILPSKSALTTLICRNIHRITLHAGPQHMQAMLLQRYSVLGARRLLRKIALNCPKCTRHRHNQPSQLMADLPKSRVEFGRPFYRTGVDYAGPFKLRYSKGRGNTTVKGYVAVFICMCTGAMHLELSSDLSSDTFIAVYKRFIGRRGRCKELFSDNGTNFIGADKEMRKLFQQALECERTQNFLSSDCTQWHFNPPSAPHMGGFWEAAVKRFKAHLRRTMDDTLLTYEDFNTLLVEIEACVNSRPICPLSDDPDDLQILTPGHFLIGEPLITLPEPDSIDSKISLRQRWKLISQRRLHFWRRWSTEYLTELQKRKKWNRVTSNIQVGDLVLIRDEQLPPAKWRMGRVTSTQPGADGLVRVVNVRTQGGTFTRPIVKLCPLPNLRSDND